MSKSSKEDSIYSCPHSAIKREIDAWLKCHKELAMANSHSKARIPSGDGRSYKKWCVFCGRPFNTVNETRQTCGACQKEIFRKDDLKNSRRKEKKREARREARRKASRKAKN